MYLLLAPITAAYFKCGLDEIEETLRVEEACGVIHGFDIEGVPVLYVRCDNFSNLSRVRGVWELKGEILKISSRLATLTSGN